MAEMENVKEEAASLTKELCEEGCDQCVYTQGEVTLQNIKGWSDISIAYQFYICKLPIHFQVMKIMEWTYGVAFDGFVPKECLLIEVIKDPWFEKLSLEREVNIKLYGASYNIDGALNDVGAGTTPYNLTDEYMEFLPV